MKQQIRQKLADAQLRGFRIFYLWFDESIDRWRRGHYGLHCGDHVEALIDGEWVQTRIEHTSPRWLSSGVDHSRGWYLCDYPDQPLDDLIVRTGPDREGSL